MYAIVETSGRQVQLEAGRFVDIDLIACEPGDSYVFDRVLMIVDGGESQIGKPFVEGAKVTGKVLSHGKDGKIIVYKQRPKKGTRKKQGHRQGYTRVLISSIAVNDKVLAEAKGEKAETKAKAAKTTEVKAEAKAPAKSAAAKKPAAKKSEAK